jgi:hypothetical protein
MEQKFKMQIQRLAKQAAAVLMAVTVGILSAAAVFSQNSNPVYAAENGIYLANANPSYRNPSTGAIEDSGGEGSAVLGQSMTESATYGKALIEADPAGNTYATIRMQLMDNIENPQFQVDGSPVSATLMQEDYSSNTADYRFRINSENSVVRVNMYVTAMGRDIIYYITFSGLSEGAGDFITSVTVEEKGGSAGSDSAESGSEESNPGESSSGERGVSAQAENTASGTDSLSGETGVSAGTDGSQENAGTQSIEQAEGESAESTTEAGQTTSAEASAAQAKTAENTQTKNAGIQEYDAAGKQVNAEVQESKKNTSTGIFIGMGVVIAIVVTGAAWYMLVYRKKKN